MSVDIPYRRDLKFEYGRVDRLSPGIRRVIANNPGPFTFYGTGTYILGTGTVAVIDPGPDDAEHIEAILAATRGETITHVLVTHTHMDHSPGCALLREHSDAPTYAFGPHAGGAGADGDSGEAGADHAFDPDVRVTHGQVLQGNGWSVECVYTPGHTSNHVCFQLREERALFTGDHVMGWSTSVIVPPDGNMRDYMASLDVLLARDDAVYWPTHGPCIEETHAHVRAFIAHRQDRERQILHCLAQDIHRIEEMVPVMYTEIPEEMYPAAAKSVFAHVIQMVDRGELREPTDVTIDAEYFLA